MKSACTSSTVHEWRTISAFDQSRTTHFKQSYKVHGTYFNNSVKYKALPCQDGVRPQTTNHHDNWVLVQTFQTHHMRVRGRGGGHRFLPSDLGCQATIPNEIWCRHFMSEKFPFHRPKALRITFSWSVSWLFRPYLLCRWFFPGLRTILTTQYSKYNKNLHTTVNFRIHPPSNKVLLTNITSKQK